MTKPERICRRDLLRGAAAVIVGGITWRTTRRTSASQVWQLDPEKCVQCGHCATYCVLNPSAVKCINSYEICGYCDLCPGYLQPGAKLDTGAESLLCPTSALTRKFIEDPYFEYIVDEDLCVGCGKCVKGCALFGNASLYLQVKRDLCVDCNDCAIARACPAEAYQRIPVEQAYLLKMPDKGVPEQA
ncbi:MAG: ferredoxin [Candidatus Hydrogenedentes bacterium]|nr:ferredoxin [Candidatus Hydrogenedentota bacterium]